MFYTSGKKTFIFDHLEQKLKSLEEIEHEARIAQWSSAGSLYLSDIGSIPFTGTNLVDFLRPEFFMQSY